MGIVRGNQFELLSQGVMCLSRGEREDLLFQLRLLHRPSRQLTMLKRLAEVENLVLVETLLPGTRMRAD